MQLFDEHPLLVPVSGLAIGMIAALSWSVAISSWLVLIVMLVLMAVAFLRSPLFFQAVLGVFCVCWGMAAMQPLLNAMEHPSILGVSPVEGTLVIEGVVVRRPLELPQGQRFEVDLERIVTSQGEAASAGRLLVTVAKGEGRWLTGDRIRVQGSLRKPRRLGLPGEFEYARHLAMQGIDAILWVQDTDQVVVMRSNARFSLQRLLDHAAQRCNQAIRHAVHDPAAASVLMALVTGSQAGIAPELSTAYARAGVSHILSISGFHVAVIAATVAQLLLLLLLRWEWLALRWNLRRCVLLATLPVMVLYLFFTGGAPATARSVVMLAAVVLAWWTERESQALDALLLAALVLVIHSPAVLFELSFQLSFLSLWGIVVLTPLLLTPFEAYLSGWRQQVALFFASSLAAVLATSVPTLAAFHQASLTGVLANLVVVPLLGYGAVLLGAAAVPLMYVVPTLARGLFGVAGWLVEISNLFVLWIADLPVLRSYQVGMLDLAASIVALAVLSFVASVRLRVLLLGGVCAGILMVHLWPAPHPDGRLRLTFLSVGQAEATLLQFPDRSTMLIDGGGYLRDTGRDFGERYLIPALHRLGIARIDRLVLTHPHPDHLGGLPAVVEQFPIGEFWQGPWQDATDGDYARLQATLQRRGVPVRQIRADTTPIRLGNCQVTMFVPPAGMLPVEWDGEAGNESSVVLRLDFEHFSALFMADAGLQTEQRLLRQHMAPVTLLKVGHHGSRTASGEWFIRQIRPQLAVISVGAGNRFGLPAPETVARLTRHGSHIYRTDQDGTIQVETDGNSYQVKTDLGRQ